MNNTPFKTPLSHHNFRSAKAMYTPKSLSERSESVESLASDNSEGSTGSNDHDLSILAMFDDLLRLMKNRRDQNVENAFLDILMEIKKLAERYNDSINECQRLQHMLDMKSHEYIEVELRLTKARKILDEQKKKTQQITREKEKLEDQLDQVRELLFRDNRVKIGDDAREKLSFLHKNNANDCYNAKTLSCIQEINSTGSMLSDFSVSKSEDDLDTSHQFIGKNQWKKHRSSDVGAVPEPAVKKRRSGSKTIEIGVTDTVRATTTVTVNKKGPITATSIIESVPNDEECIETDIPMTTDEGFGSTAPSAPLSHLILESWGRQDKEKSPRKAYKGSNFKSDQRQHSLQQKTIVMPDSCICCEKRIKFGKSVLKCKDCRSVCHTECEDRLPLPCIPLVLTPNCKNAMGIISDYTPTLPPMVPALVIHCLNEIELRGLNELGIYRIPGSEKDVKMLKEKFLKGRGCPALSQLDIHVICGCVKDFLRSLTEPIITYQLWRDFVRAVEARDPADVAPCLYQLISQLPQPNRDTLAYMIVHLQKVSESPACKMPIENLAKVFGPTIVGFSSDDPSPHILLTETRQQIAVMEQLIRLPADYWSSFINIGTPKPMRMQQTPSTDSLLRSPGRFFTLSGNGRVNNNRHLKKQRFFPTPPHF